MKKNITFRADDYTLALLDALEKNDPDKTRSDLIRYALISLALEELGRDALDQIVLQTFGHNPRGE